MPSEADHRWTWEVLSIRKFVHYFKLSLPHVALVVVCMVYAILGALIFYYIEAQNERFVKSVKIQRIVNSTQRSHINLSKASWYFQASKGLHDLKVVLCEAFETDFVTVDMIDYSSSGDANKISNSVWTIQSSVFFAMTTMVTIGLHFVKILGYGNVVPMTAEGRLLCIIFALFGCPLAIITIGNLGKFLSETVVFLYNKIQRGKMLLIKSIAIRFPLLKGLNNYDNFETTSLTYEDIVVDDTGISAFFVLSIFIFYNAAGALLFTSMERWSFMDSLYFCFISISTVGFGDFVPKNDPWYIVLYCYTALGIAITTMCIDLVGTRRLKGADLIRYLRHKRMKEEKQLLALKTTECIESYLKSINQIKEPTEELPVQISYCDGTKYEESIPFLSTPANVLHFPLDNEPLLSEEIEQINVQNFSLAKSTNLPDLGTYFLSSFWSSSVKTSHQSVLLSNNEKVEISTFPLSETISLLESARNKLSLFVRNERPSSVKSVQLYCSDQPKDVGVRRAYSAEVPPLFNEANSLPEDLLFSKIEPANDEHADVQSQLDIGNSESPDSVKKFLMTESDEILSSTEVEDFDLSEISSSSLNISELSPVSSLTSSPTQSIEVENASQGKFVNEPDEWPEKLTHDLCFVLDGGKLQFAYGILLCQTGLLTKKDPNWTCHVHPAKFYHSANMKIFERVNAVMSGGKVVAAYPTSKSRKSFAGSSKFIPSFVLDKSATVKSADSKIFTAKSVKRAESLSPKDVYKTTRVYSFWKRCPSFHRICTIIQPSDPAAKIRSHIYVQYIWRDAKEKDKQAVIEEIKRQKLSLMPSFISM
ncbi:TWiK family of potassium channels protein 7 [Trichinella pseudospiralis]|uniref:TWiK family of potassium channels protein 7 n=1 Tax=Trichinella pseudospiralis TaxID=6337 RepID=A0A0V1E0W3_TRIPS|nr:TWiK family of potassium channels protein 7 [Trichinella pseudospiralis]KRZ22906.1 TWiK family of potassium channels protein 7 [Trichinella pseudospiralis]